MTYQQKFEELRKDFVEKGEKYVKAEKLLSSILGWGDSDELNLFLNSKKAFEEADKKLHDFLSDMKEKNIPPQELYN